MPALPRNTTDSAVSNTPNSTPDKPDMSSVRSLVTSVSKLAKAMRLTNNAIYRWIAVNRIPAKYLVRVANFYDVELRDLLELTGSDKSHKNISNIKPRSVLRTLMEVYRGNKTLEDAEAETGQPPIALKLILTHWGDELPTLYTALEQLDQGRIDLEEACIRLNVAKYTLHGLRRKYGYAPGKLKKQNVTTIDARRETNQEAAFLCIAGKMKVAEAAEKYEVSGRTIFRTIEELSHLKMMELTKWPNSMRAAYAEELKWGLEKYVEGWMEFAERSRLFMPKIAFYPDTPDTWRGQPLRRLLVALLLGEDTMSNIAKSRGADPSILANLFTGDLQPLVLTYEQVVGMNMAHQTALAELLLATMNRKRKWS